MYISAQSSTWIFKQSKKVDVFIGLANKDCDLMWFMPVHATDMLKGFCQFCHNIVRLNKRIMWGDRQPHHRHIGRR
jgi:hypothetical protein